MQQSRSQYLTTLYLAKFAIAWMVAIQCGCVDSGTKSSEGIQVFSSGQPINPPSALLNADRTWRDSNQQKFDEVANSASGSSRHRAPALTANDFTSPQATAEGPSILSTGTLTTVVPKRSTPAAPTALPTVVPSVVPLNRPPLIQDPKGAQDPRRGSAQGSPRGNAQGAAPQGRASQGAVPAIKRTNEQQLLLRSARNAVALDQIDEAADLFESYLVLLPTDLEVRIEYAGLLVQKGRLDEARDLFLKTLEDLPYSNEIRQRLVDVLIISGEYAAATTHLEEMVRIDPDNVAAAAMLCRAYSWVKDLEKAKTVYDRYLRKLDPSSQRDQKMIAPALLDMQKPREALPYLLKLQQQSPNELQWATSLVYCYELLGDEPRATRAVDSIASLEPLVTEPRVHLVDQLLSLSNYQLAQRVNEQILKVEPDNVMARLMGARILLESYDVRRAQEALAGLETELGGMRRYSLATAQLYHLEGQWVASQSIYEAMLLDRSNDDEIRIKLSLLMRDKGDLHKALAELRKVPVDSPYGSLAQLEQATTLILQGRPDKAAGLCAQIADMRPNDVAPVIGLVRAHLEMGHTEEAQTICQQFIDKHPSDKMAIAQVRVVLGKAQLMSGNSVQAARTYQLAMREPSMHEPEAFYGLARARARGDFAVGVDLAKLSSNIATSGEGIRMRVELGKLALGEQDYTRAIYYLSKALRWQPNNVAAKVLLGEAYNLSLKAGVKKSPVKVFASILEGEPGNTRARLGLARAHAIKREFPLAIDAYQKVLEQDSSYDYAAREHARVLFWDQQYEESYKHYEELLARLPSEGMAVDFFDDPTDNLAIQELSDFESGTDFAESVRLEFVAKQNMAFKPPMAQAALEQLTIREPANQEALFDLAQIEHRRGMTKDAITHYKELIRVAGGHQEAMKALSGAERELNPSVNFTFNTEERNGRDGLSFLEETSHIADARFILDDRDDSIGFGIGRRTYKPGVGNGFHTGSTDTLNANVLRFLGSTRIAENTVLDLTTEFATYDSDDRFSDRLYFDGGVTYTSDDQTRVKMRLFNEPVAENAETMIRDIYRQGGRIGVEMAMSRRLDWGVSGMLADYGNDDNTRVEGNAFIAYEFLAAPTELRVLVKADFIDCTNETNIDDLNAIGGPVWENLDTPYFSPKAYSVYTIQTNWRHQLGKDWFTGADNMYYTVSGGLAIDSNSVGFVEFSMGGGYDITNFLNLEAGMRMVRSSAIDITSGYAEMTIRWP